MHLKPPVPQAIAKGDNLYLRYSDLLLLQEVTIN